MEGIVKFKQTRFFVLLVFFTLFKCNTIYAQQITDNELLGSVWIGQRIIRTNDGSNSTNNISMTFLDGSYLQILEWNLDSKYVASNPFANERYEYELSVSENILFVYRNEVINRDNINGDDEIIFDELYTEIRRKYIAVIGVNFMTFEGWFDEDIVLIKRDDLSGSGHNVVVKNTYYENGEYFVIIECKLLPPDIAYVVLMVSLDQAGSSQTLRRWNAIDIRWGYNIVTLSFAENELKEIEEEIIRDLIFQYVDKGWFSPEDRAAYLASNNPPRLSYVRVKMLVNTNISMYSEKKQFR